MKFKNKEEFIAHIAATAAADKLARREEHLHRWNTLKPFVTNDDVPELPVVDAKTWTDFYVPRLLAAGAIPKADLKIGTWYYGEYRNATFGQWNGTNFDHWRWKHGQKQWQENQANHFEDDNGFALFVPLREATAEELAGI